MANLYYDGEKVRVTATFTDSNGDAADPAVVRGSFRFSPDTSATAYLYGTDAELVKDSTGIYYFDVDTTDKAGQWCYLRFWSTGAGQAAKESKFRVERTRF